MRNLSKDKEKKDEDDPIGKVFLMHSEIIKEWHVLGIIIDIRRTVEAHSSDRILYVPVGSCHVSELPLKRGVDRYLYNGEFKEFE